MGTINGYLNIGTAIASGNVVVTPPASGGYAAQLVSFEPVNGGVALNDTTALFGPVSGSWGTIAAIGVTDLSGHPMYAGPVTVPFTPVSGQTVIVPPGSVSLLLGTQFTVAAFTASVASGIIASGSTQGTATALSAQYNVVNTVASGTGVLVPSIITGNAAVLNRGANALSVYPPAGAQIEALGLNNPLLLNPDTGVDLITVGGSAQWYVGQTTAFPLVIPPSGVAALLGTTAASGTAVVLQPGANLSIASGTLNATGPYTSGVLSPTGYLTLVDASGVSRRVLTG